MAGSLKPDRSQRHSADQVLAYIAVGDKDRHGVVVPTIISSLSDENREVSAQDFSPTRRKNRCFTRNFSKVIKSVLFETTLIKRIRSKKSRKNSFQAVHCAENEKFSNLIRENLRAPEPPEIQCSGTEIRRTNSTVLRPQRSASAGHLPPEPIFQKCSSSPASKLSLSPRKSTSSEKKPPVRHHTAKLIKKRSSYTGLCLFLVSLFALIFWGKICAIFCASTWLLLLPHYNRESMLSDHRDLPGVQLEWPGHRPSQDHRDSSVHRPSMDHRPSLDHRGSPDHESAEHKKKVVMGGLLERSCRRNSHTASFLSSKF